MSRTTKQKRIAQTKAGCDGYQTHINKWEKRIANGVMRAFDKKEIEEQILQNRDN